ncbi:MAG: TMEM43 family protein [Deltaproteobacteria bacterium]|nr:TMEM43 family protein [Deltaproteobacteria bacterium]
MIDDDGFNVSSNQGSSGDDRYDEETTTGWGGRIGESLKGLLFGIVLTVCAGILLFWNEGRTVKMSRALDETSNILVSLQTPAVDPVNNGKPVHVTGDAGTVEVLSDKSFGVSGNAIRLRRSVEIYQWKEAQQTETTKNLGGSSTKHTTYTYTKVWSDHLNSSAAFKKPEGHANPAQVAYGTQDFWANEVKLGSFNLPRSLLQKLTNFESLPMEPSLTEKMPAPLKSQAQVLGDWCYLGNPQTPGIGDLRVKFEIIRPGTVSIVARQVQNTFEPYTASSGKTVELIEPGIHSPDSMFTDAKNENKMIAWVLRAVGAVCIYIGIFLIMRPFSVFLDVIPLIGNIAGFGIGLAAMVIALILSLLIIAAAWFSYRPLLSVVLVCAVVVSILLMGMTKKRRIAGA